MNETTAPSLTSEGSGGKPFHDGTHGDHPTERKYVLIAVILAALTGIEVGLYYTSFEESITNIALLSLAAFKFAIVALYFMHLRFDNHVLRQLFITGFVLAASIYVTMLGMFGAVSGRLVVTGFAVLFAFTLGSLVGTALRRR